MTTLDETPTFNLKAVVQETGIKPDTLRAWERRYGLPQPARSSGGHRLYSQHDIDTLKWLMDRQDEGLSISRAVDLWNQLLAEGKDPFWEMGDDEQVVGQAPLEVGDTLTELRETWVDACLAYDEQRAVYTLSQAFALYAVETVCVELLQKGLFQIGEMWYEGNATAQQEHFASALAIRRLETLLSAAPPPARQGRILIGCPPEEEHTFSPLLLSLFLRRRGWDVVYLGANVPVDRLERTIERAQPHLVVLSAQTLHTAGTLLGMANYLEEMAIPLAFGGLIFNALPDLLNYIPGHFLGRRLQEAPARIEQLLTNPSVKTTAASPSDAYRRALNQFQQRQSAIESTIWDRAGEMNIATPHLTRANRNMAQNIIAALKLGDMDLLGYDMEWIQGLLSNHNGDIPATVLQHYLALYGDAAERHLNGQGTVVVSWFEKVLETAGPSGSSA